MKTYLVEDDYNIPQDLIQAMLEDKVIQIKTVIGWIDLEDPDFRNSCEYRVVED